MTARTHQDAPGSTQRAGVGREPYLTTRMRLLGRLQQGPVWTLDLRREPDRWSANPAQRVAELRTQHPWHDVRTVRVNWPGNPSCFRDYYVLAIKKQPVLGTFRDTWIDSIRAKWRE